MWRVDIRLARLRAAVNPAVGGRLEAFRDAVAALAAAPSRPCTVAVVGLVPGAGRSTVTAVLALAAAAFSDRRVVVIDTVASPTGPRTVPGRPPAGDDVAGRSVTALLGGDVLQGRLAQLVEGAPTDPAHPSTGAGAVAVARRQVRSSFTPGASVPMLSLPPGPGGFAPQLLERALDRLAYRADLVLLDTPVGPRAPVLHAVLDLADHYLLVARTDQDVPRQERAGRLWLTEAPGRPRRRTASLVLVSRGLRAPRPDTALGAPDGSPRLPITVLGRDEALRRRQPDQLSRSTMITALRLAAGALAAEPSGPTVTG